MLNVIYHSARASSALNIKQHFKKTINERLFHMNGKGGTFHMIDVFQAPIL